MNLSNKRQLKVYLFWTVVVGLLLVSVLMVMPFVGAIISAYILAYLVRPLFLKIKPRFGTTLAALLCIIITVILIVVPIGLISIELLNQLKGVSTSQGISDIVDAVATQPFLKNLNLDTAGLKSAIILTVNNLISSVVMSAPSFVIGLVITLNGMFYLLCRWDNIASHVKKYLPFKNNEKMLIDLGSTADAIIRGHVLVSVLEGIVAFIGFSLIGIETSLIFAVLIFILAFAPGIGPEMVWIPLALYYLSLGQYTIMFEIVILGVILMVGIEFYLYTRFVGSRAHIHPFILLIGILGGIGVFGIFGFIIGPLLLVTSIEIIEKAIESREIKNKTN